MRIVIVGYFLYPDGSAAASRIRHFARRYSDFGHEVFVIALRPYVESGYTYSEDGKWVKDGTVNYCRIIGKNSNKKKNQAKHIYNLFGGYSISGKKSIAKLDDLSRKDRIDAMIIYSTWYIGTSRLVKYAKKRNITLLWDVVELFSISSYPLGYINPAYWNHWLGFKYLIPRCDGLIAISSYLKNIFKLKQMPVIRIPAIINVEEFMQKLPKIADQEEKSFQFTYLGSMDWRDGPMVLLKAFEQLINDGDDAFLNIVGTNGCCGHAKIAKEYVEANLSITNRVKFWGRVSYEDLYKRLALSDCFIFNRLSGYTSEAAFPSRLPEFLSTGKPVIASNVSDIAEYLKDGQETFIVMPDSIESLARGMKRVLAHADKGLSVGKAGAAKCKSVFNDYSRSKQIIEFINDIKHN